ncbi:hypothetical protein CRENBAI_018075 [Crenichthys baileyi]|uniref:Uncharacterized protein n=1 Tax=Crenichthys baileyi TaxID=28760 RepID=A0AAV9RJ08_9TELE
MSRKAVSSFGGEAGGRGSRSPPQRSGDFTQGPLSLGLDGVVNPRIRKKILPLLEPVMKTGSYFQPPPWGSGRGSKVGKQLNEDFTSPLELPLHASRLVPLAGSFCHIEVFCRTNMRGRTPEARGLQGRRCTDLFKNLFSQRAEVPTSSPLDTASLRSLAKLSTDTCASSITGRFALGLSSITASSYPLGAPSLSGPSVDIVQQRPSIGFDSIQAGPSRGEILNAVDPLPPEMSEHGPASGPLDLLMAGDDELSDLDSEMPFSDNDEDYDPSPPPSGWVAKPTSSGAG